MSEFVLDYKCMALGSEESPINDKALDFRIFQYYTQDEDAKRGAPALQIRIPMELRKDVIGAKMWISRNGVDFPDIKDIPWGDFIERGGSDSGQYMNDKNSFYLDPEGTNWDLSCCGLIGFMRKHQDKPDFKDTYCFYVNFSHKVVIRYRISETITKVKVQIAYPVIRKDTELVVIGKKDFKPVLKGDFDPKNIMHDKKGNVMEIKLPSSKVMNNNITKVFHIKPEDRRYYRLAFRDEIKNKYYRLEDDSDYSFEDADIRKKQLKFKRPALGKSPVRCPFCNKPLGKIPKIPKNTIAIYTCQGEKKFEVKINKKTQDFANDWIFDSEQKIVIKDMELRGEGDSGKLTVVCGSDLEKESNSVLSNNMILPDGFQDSRSMNVTVVGYPGCGKTVLLSSLFHMVSDENTTSIKSKSFIFKAFIKKFLGSNSETIDEVKYNRVEEKMGPLGQSTEYVISKDIEAKRNSKEDIDQFKDRFSISPGNSIESQTRVESHSKLSWMPIGYRMNKLGYVYFYDVPGELFKRQTKDDIRSIRIADSIIAIIDGSKDINGKSNIASPIEELNRALDKLCIENENARQLPIAIVISKLDCRLHEYSSMPSEQCFDDNAQVAIEDMWTLLPSKSSYKGSDLERHIDRSSYEIEHFLRTYPDGRSLWNRIHDPRNGFSNVKFFACSALGCDDCLGSVVNNMKEVLNEPRRIRIELPVLWLMYQRHLIKE